MMSTAKLIEDQFDAMFGQDDRDDLIARNAETIARLKQIQPHMKAMADALDPIHTMTIQQCMDALSDIESSLRTHLQHNRDSSNLDEAADLVADAIVDLAAHLREDEIIPCECGKCDECVTRRSDEHYDRKRDGESA